MRILVYEFVTGGGPAAREVPASLAREGAAMRAAIIADLNAIGGHQIVTATSGTLDAAIASVDAVWLIAPETDGCLQRLAAQVERNGKRLLGSSADAVRRASDKEGLALRLARHRISHPMTRVVRNGAGWESVAREVGYPLVIKPRCGAGSQGVSLANSAADVPRALEGARRVSRNEAVLMQRYIAGTAASVSLLADGARAIPLMINAQHLSGSPNFTYEGGRSPLEHPFAVKALTAAMRTCDALPGLQGYVGVDVVLTESDAVVIEVNPRLTTAYLGVRSALKENVAELAIAACEGHLPGPLVAQQSVRFTAWGDLGPA